MFDLGWQELLIIAIVTLIVVGPKDLPMLFNKAGKLVGNIKQISREFFDKINEVAEVDEMNKLKSSMSDITDFDSFMKIDIRVGEIVRVEPYPEAKKPALKLWIDFGPELGERKSSAQITKYYSPETLVGRQIIAVVNFKPRQIGKFVSEVLVLGVPDGEGDGVILVEPEAEALVGGRVH